MFVVHRHCFPSVNGPDNTGRIKAQHPDAANPPQIMKCQQNPPPPSQVHRSAHWVPLHPQQWPFGD